MYLQSPEDVDTIKYRKLLKIKNYDIWKSIIKVTEIRYITLTLLKIKAHSNNLLNDRADQLSKEGSQSTYSLELKETWLLSDKMCNIKWNDKYIIADDPRKWLDGPLQAHNFNKLLNTSSLKPIHSAIHLIN
jgi:hypothetical protein